MFHTPIVNQVRKRQRPTEAGTPENREVKFKDVRLYLVERKMGRSRRNFLTQLARSKGFIVEDVLRLGQNPNFQLVANLFSTTRFCFNWWNAWETKCIVRNVKRFRVVSGLYLCASRSCLYSLCIFESKNNVLLAVYWLNNLDRTCIAFISFSGPLKTKGKVAAFKCLGFYLLSNKNCWDR